MPRTRRDLVTEALDNLGLIAAGQVALAEDFEAVDNKVDGLIAYLETSNDVGGLTIDNIDEIPDELFEPIAVLLADVSALKFGMAGVPTSPSNPNPVQSAKDRIISILYGRPTGEPQRTEYF